MTDVTALLSGLAGLYCMFRQLDEPDFEKNLGGEKSHPDAGLGVGQLEALAQCSLGPAARGEPPRVGEDPVPPCSAHGTCSLSFKAPSSPSASLLTLKG